MFAVVNSCHFSSPKLNLSHFTQNVMTIDYHIMIGDSLTANQVKQVKEIIDSTFQEIDAIYNKWNPDSELSQLNAFPAHTPFFLSLELNQFLQHVDQLVKLSEGRFDPTIEPIQQLWKVKLEQGQRPTIQEIERLKPCIGWNTLHIANGVIYKEDERTQIDLGGIAKGYCVDLLVNRLHQIELESIYVEWGGEIRTQGLHPSKRPWKVYISRLANADPNQAIAQIDLFNRALATSGDYFQYWKVQDDEGKEKIYCHIFNPLTLSPLEVKIGSVASSSLLALNCMTADALAKVLMLFDSVEEAQSWIEKIQKQLPDLACWIATRSASHHSDECLQRS